MRELRDCLPLPVEGPSNNGDVFVAFEAPATSFHFRKELVRRCQTLFARSTPVLRARKFNYTETRQSLWKLERATALGPIHPG